ncbi:carbohydrate kinase [Nonomuraea longicatena]|uniref:Carbohydrate kinase n=1 Tax=Nonomuraea longicatena TaxID=83682 RepID=A0ABP3Z8P3_9ACTN
MLVHVIAVLGECVADAFATRRNGQLTLRVHPGGGPANTAVALARLGTPTRFLGRIADDVFGRLFRDHLADSGVDLTAAVPAAEPSTLAIAALDAEGQAAYSFHADGAADWQWTADELDPHSVGGVSCLHTGSLALVREPGADAVAGFVAALAPHATISIDPNVRPGLAGRAAYLARLPMGADILKLSEEDLGYLLPGTALEEGCDTWHAAGVRLVVVTRGAAGALVSLDGERVRVPGVPVKVVDTVGAGDAFTAGLLHHLGAAGLLGGRLDGLDLEAARAAAVHGARVAALTCTVPGADPPWFS